MTSVNDIRAKLADQSEQLRKCQVAQLWLFGSAARQEAEIHDLDFLVEFSSAPGLLEYMNLKFLLEETFGLPVDLHSRKTCPERFYERIRGDLKHVA